MFFRHFVFGVVGVLACLGTSLAKPTDKKCDYLLLEVGYVVGLSAEQREALGWRGARGAYGAVVTEKHPFGVTLLPVSRETLNASLSRPISFGDEKTEQPQTLLGQQSFDLWLGTTTVMRERVSRTNPHQLKVVTSFEETEAGQLIRDRKDNRFYLITNKKLRDDGYAIYYVDVTVKPSRSTKKPGPQVKVEGRPKVLVRREVTETHNLEVVGTAFEQYGFRSQSGDDAIFQRDLEQAGTIFRIDESNFVIYRVESDVKVDQGDLADRGPWQIFRASEISAIDQREYNRNQTIYKTAAELEAAAFDLYRDGAGNYYTRYLGKGRLMPVPDLNFESQAAFGPRVKQELLEATAAKVPLDVLTFDLPVFSDFRKEESQR
ncbi:MAG TPA: hypothetical protein VM901_13750 [Bdellovibrionota bacterium]|jgi:hypothetical protein|nr:hypothetical protein [Bdellovibrionota bacterium]